MDLNTFLLQLQHTQKTGAKLELYSASRGLAVAPRPTHTAALLCSLSPAHNGCRAQLGERGALYFTLASRGRIARSPGWRRIVKKWKTLHGTCTNACAAVHSALHDTGTNSVPTHVLLYDTYCLSTYCCVRRAGGVERQKRHTGPALALSAIPFPVSRVFSAVLLLYYYRTHILGSWVVGCSFSAA